MVIMCFVREGTGDLTGKEVDENMIHPGESYWYVNMKVPIALDFGNTGTLPLQDNMQRGKHLM